MQFWLVASDNIAAKIEGPAIADQLPNSSIDE